MHIYQPYLPPTPVLALSHKTSRFMISSVGCCSGIGSRVRIGVWTDPFTTQTMELVSLGVNENQSILGVGVISSLSLGVGAHLCSINNLTFLDQRNQHTYLLRHFILPIPFHPTLLSVQHPSVGHTVQLSLRALPTTTLPTRTLNYVPTFFCCSITSSSLFSYLFVLSEVSLMCTFRN